MALYLKNKNTGDLTPVAGLGGGGGGTGTVTSVNGQAPDDYGNVNLIADNINLNSGDSIQDDFDDIHDAVLDLNNDVSNLTQTVSNQGQAILGIEGDVLDLREVNVLTETEATILQYLDSSEELITRSYADDRYTNPAEKKGFFEPAYGVVLSGPVEVYQVGRLVQITCDLPFQHGEVDGGHIGTITGVDLPRTNGVVIGNTVDLVLPYNNYALAVTDQGEVYILQDDLFNTGDAVVFNVSYVATEPTPK
jgi:hypothetical protein